MKTALIRILAIATLATSMTAFAATDEPNRDDAATSVLKKQDGCPESAGHGKKQKKAKPSQSDDRKEKELDRLLMGIYG